MLTGISMTRPPQKRWNWWNGTLWGEVTDLRYICPYNFQFSRYCSTQHDAFCVPYCLCSIVWYLVLDSRWRRMLSFSRTEVFTRWWLLNTAAHCPNHSSLTHHSRKSWVTATGIHSGPNRQTDKQMEWRKGNKWTPAIIIHVYMYSFCFSLVSVLG